VLIKIQSVFITTIGYAPNTRPYTKNIPQAIELTILSRLTSVINIEAKTTNIDTYPKISTAVIDKI